MADRRPGRSQNPARRGPQARHPRQARRPRQERGGAAVARRDPDRDRIGGPDADPVESRRREEQPPCQQHRGPARLADSEPWTRRLATARAQAEARGPVQGRRPAVRQLPEESAGGTAKRVERSARRHVGYRHHEDCDQYRPGRRAHPGACRTARPRARVPSRLAAASRAPRCCSGASQPRQVPGPRCPGQT